MHRPPGGKGSSGRLHKKPRCPPQWEALMALGGSGRLNIGDQDTIQKVYRGTFIEGCQEDLCTLEKTKKDPKRPTK